MKPCLCIAVVLLALPVQAQGNEIIVVGERLTATRDPQLLVASTPVLDGLPVDEIRLSLPKKFSTKLEADYLPDGWRAQADKAGIVLNGPARAGGEALGISFDYTGKLGLDQLQLKVDLLAAGRFLDSDTHVPVKLDTVGLTDRVTDYLRMPYAISPGESITFRPEWKNKTPGGGTWTIDGEEAEWNGDFKDVEYKWTLGNGYKMGSKLTLGVRYTDAWGETLVEGTSGEFNVVPATSDEKPSIGDCSPEVLTGEVFCVCGNFPTAGSRVGLTLNGKPLGRPISESKSALTFRLPEGVPPGEFVVAGAATAGYGANDQATGLHVAVGASIDSNLLRRGQSTPLRLWIEGTTKPVTMRVWNETPEIVSLNPSNDQQVTTSGGSPNDVSRRVDAVSVGDFVLNYELTIGSCPCAEQLAEQAGTTTTEGDATTVRWDDELQSTRERCRDLDAECEELRVLAELAEDWARTLRTMAKDAARNAEWHEERANWLDQVAEGDRDYLNTLRRQAADWRALADDARADAKKNWERNEKYPDTGWDYWARLDEENARRRDEAAERLETEAARLEREMRTDSAEAEELRNRADETARQAEEAEEQAAAARTAYEDCLRRKKAEEKECDWSYSVELRYSTSWGLGLGSSGWKGSTTSTTGTPPGDDPRDEGRGDPVGEEIDEEEICPQRDGHHKSCVALIIDIAKHDDWRPGSLTDSKEYLEELGCDVDYVAPSFRSVPPAYSKIEKEVRNAETGEWETKEEIVKNDRSQNANVAYNARQMDEVNDAINRHRAKMRQGVIMAVQMVYAHGSTDTTGDNCGWLGPSIDFYTNGISRKYFHDGNYRSAKDNVCIWHTVDASCYSWQTPRAVDELNNHGRTDCHMDTQNVRDLHAGYEMDIAQACAKQGWWEACTNYGIAYFEDDINDVWEDEVDRKEEAGYGPETAFTEMLPELRKAVQSNVLSFSTYADKGYEECVPPQHTRVGPYWK